MCTQITGADIFDVLKDQILHFDVHKSTFDIVMSAICRFVVLLLFYALISMNHWCIIAVSLFCVEILIINGVFFKVCFFCSLIAFNCWIMQFSYLQGVCIQRKFILYVMKNSFNNLLFKVGGSKPTRFPGASHSSFVYIGLG